MTIMAERDKMPNMYTGEMMDLGRPASTRPEPQPGVARNDAAEALMPPEYRTVQTAGPVAESTRFDYGRAFNPAYQPGAVEYKPPVLPPVVGPGATEPRPPAQDAAAPAPAAPGPIASAVGMAPKPGVSVIGGQPDARFELAMMKAKEDQAYLDREAAMRQGIAAAGRQTTREDDLRNRHFAQKAQQAGSSVLNYAWGQDTARAESNVNRARPDAAGVALPPGIGGDPSLGMKSASALGARNLIQEQLAEEQLREQRATGQQTRATGAISQEAEKLKVAQAQRIDAVSQELFSATDPKVRNELSQKLLSLLGKDKPDEYTVHAVTMPDSVDPNTGAVLKGGQAVAVVNRMTGAREIMSIGGNGASAQAAAATKPKSFDEFLAKARSDPANKAFTDDQLKAFYAKTYGTK